MEKSTNPIGDLYGLRAVLSVVSQECDVIRNIEADAQSENEEIDGRIKSHEELIDKQKERIERGAENSSEHNRFCRSLTIRLILTLAVCIACSLEFIPVKNKYADMFNYMVFVCGGFLGLTLICIALIVEDSLFDARYGHDDLFDYGEFMIYLVCIIGIISGIVTVPIFIVNGIDNHAVGYCGLLFAGILFGGVFALKNFIRLIINGGFINRKKYLSGYIYEKEQLEKETDNIVRECAQNRQDVALRRAQNLQPHIRNVNNMYLILRRLFQPILDERDWKNLDLVIYYLETRRADSIKEALQLVDRELQTQRIENLVISATQTIVNTIKSGLSILQQSLGAVYNGLSEQMRVMSGQLSSVSAQLVDTQILNRALIAKADVTSEALVNDMHRIRSNSDYMRYTV